MSAVVAVQNENTEVGVTQRRPAVTLTGIFPHVFICSLNVFALCVLLTGVFSQPKGAACIVASWGCAVLNLAAREIKDGWPSESRIMVDSTPRTSHIQPQSSTSRTRSSSAPLAGFMTTQVNS